MTSITTLKKEAREKAAFILTPLISQIFHGENYTSGKIHEELDKALDAFALFADHIHAETVKSCMKVLPEERIIHGYIASQNTPESNGYNTYRLQAISRLQALITEPV